MEKDKEKEKKEDKEEEEEKEKEEEKRKTSSGPLLVGMVVARGAGLAAPCLLLPTATARPPTPQSAMTASTATGSERADSGTGFSASATSGCRSKIFSE
jgi:cytoskeletal protein RodZ